MIKRIFRRLYQRIRLEYIYFREEVARPYRNLSETERKCSFLTYAFNYYYFGCSVDEYNFFGLNKQNAYGKNQYVTMRKNRKLDRMFNDGKSNRILWDKGLFNDYFRDYISREFIFVNSNTTDAQLRDFYQKLNGGGIW